jgi:uncharacterized protein (DUF433 family)
MHAFTATLPPLTQGADGVIRVTGTRVQLETLVVAFDAGATAEEMAQQYPTVTLANVYAVIAWVLYNRGAVDAYLDERARAASALRDRVERTTTTTSLRARLLARRSGAAT